MQAIPTAMAGVAALGIGFGLGAFLPEGTGEGRGVSEEGEVKIVTFEGRAGGAAEDQETAESWRRKFGLHSHASYAASEERLEELMEAYERQPGVSAASNISRERMLEEIEQILMRANEAELIAFIQGHDFDHSSSPIPVLLANSVFGSPGEIAYGMLVRIAPKRAADLWLEQRQGRSFYPGVTTLLKEWVQRDPVAAERWVEGLAIQEGAEDARAAYHTVLAEANPSKALAHLSEVDRGKAYHYGDLLVKNLDSGQLPVAAERVLEERKGGIRSNRLIGDLLSAWGKREPEAMMDWFLEQDLNTLGKDIVRHSLSGLIYEDPAGFLDRVGSELAGKPVLRDSAAGAWWRWITTEGQEPEAIRWLLEQEELSAGFGRFEDIDRYMNHEYWNSQSKNILDSFTDVPDSQEKDTLLRRVLYRLSPREPKMVLGYAMEHLPLGQQTDRLISSAVKNWADNEPKAALRWSVENLDSDYGQARAVKQAIGQWAVKDVRAAAEAWKILPDKLRVSASHDLASAWSEKDPEGLHAYLTAASDSDSLAPLAREGFRSLSKGRQAASYLDSALNMPEGKLRHQSIRGLFGGWAHSDTEAGAEAISQVPEGSLRNAAIMGFIGNTAKRDPGTAINLATRITAPTLREQALISHGREWLKQAPKEAEATIRANTAISEEVKAKIFK